MDLSALGGGGIKSVQRGVTSIAAPAAVINVTISPVNLSKAVVISNYVAGGNSGGSVTFSGSGAARLTSASNLSVQGARTGADGNISIQVFWQVLEYF
ncbi:hypothetical protein ACFO3I_05000 [Rheinheimera marina]|uniref:Uncharacterized protein n=1 Tax=Rheinheimera marina TaxID=1774958 RepID=A0ABV9JJB7_9GAMM